MIPYEFHYEAQVELAESTVFYESHVVGLGEALTSEVQRAVNIIRDHPDFSSPFGAKVRRVLVRRFPYNFIYRQDTGRIFILAVAHQHCRPGYWRHRK